LNIIYKIFRNLWIRDYRSAVLRARVFASTEHDRVIDGLNLGTVVDIGANRGQFALCARRLYPAATIYSFEPLRKPAETYRKVFGKDSRVHLFNLAIAAQAGSASMHVSRWDVSSSLLPFAQAQHDNFPLTEEARQETVSVATLADCLDRNSIQGEALLKLDVQGYELTALHGCENLIECFKYVYVEASFIELYVGQALATDVVAYLLDRGFELICVANLSKGNSQRPIQADFLFQRSGREGLTRTNT
jgi:FkbM family methyltransferase